MFLTTWCYELVRMSHVTHILVKNQVVRMSHATQICSSQLGFEGALLRIGCVCACVRVCIGDVTHSRGGSLCEGIDLGTYKGIGNAQ